MHTSLIEHFISDILCLKEHTAKSIGILLLPSLDKVLQSLNISDRRIMPVQNIVRVWREPQNGNILKDNKYTIMRNGGYKISPYTMFSVSSSTDAKR